MSCYGSLIIGQEYFNSAPCAHVPYGTALHVLGYGWSAFPLNHFEELMTSSENKCFERLKLGSRHWFIVEHQGRIACKNMFIW